MTQTNRKYIIQGEKFDQEDFEYYVFLAGTMEIQNNLEELSKRFLGFTLKKVTPGEKIDLQNKYYAHNVKQLLSGQILTINDYKFKIEE